MAGMLQQICSWLARISASLLVFITGMISVTIACRLFNLRGPIWVNQFSEYSLLAMTFFGSAWLLSLERHTAVTLVQDYLSPKSRALLKTVHKAVGASLCALLTYYTGASTLDHIRRGVVDVGSIDVPKGWVLGVIPIGFFLLTCQFLLLFGEYWAAWRILANGEAVPEGTLAESLAAHAGGGDSEG
ncbi:MAG: TRAP transporter small permease [Planctomycetota bacterium]|jgi:TRAP-type C4-dicarboxylate transport system permease small subunit|nr:TRAP transporter small permease [Planctomycetota bacterium]